MATTKVCLTMKTVKTVRIIKIYLAIKRKWLGIINYMKDSLKSLQ